MKFGFGGHSWNFKRVPDGQGGLRQPTLAEAERMIGLALDCGLNRFDSCTPKEEHSVPGEVIKRLKARQRILVGARPCHKMKGVPADAHRRARAGEFVGVLDSADRGGTPASGRAGPDAPARSTAGSIPTGWARTGSRAKMTRQRGVQPQTDATAFRHQGQRLDYFTEIEWFDRHLGQVLDLLEQAGELENTLVIVTADNGMPMLRAKATCYE